MIDPILNSVNIGNNTVRRILIDDESVVEILSYDIYENLRLKDNFENNSIYACGPVEESLCRSR